MERRVINPWTWQDQFGFVQANEITGASRQLVCSGQTSIDAEGRPANAGDMAAQIELALDNLETVLAKADFSLADVMRMTIFTTDMKAYFRASAAITQRLSTANCTSAQTVIGISQLALPDLMVEIEAIAMQ